MGNKKTATGASMCAVLSFGNGTEQAYQCDVATASISNPTELLEIRTSGSLGTAGVGAGPIKSVQMYSVDGTSDYAAIADNKGILRWIGTTSSTESFTVPSAQAANVTPSLNWKMKAIISN